MSVWSDFPTLQYSGVDYEDIWHGLVPLTLVPYPYPDDLPRTIDPCSPSARFMGLIFSDDPLAKTYYFSRGSLMRIKQDFELCAVCLQGPEGPSWSPNGFTGSTVKGFAVYGCLRWGHDINLVADTYERYVGGARGLTTVPASATAAYINTPVGGNEPSQEWTDQVVSYLNSHGPVAISG